jgi:membrane protease YdiL (CAAX protease family)
MVAAFGLFLAGTALQLWAPEHQLHGEPPITNTRLLHTLIFELLAGPLLWRLLRVRGWTRAQLGLPWLPPSGLQLGTTLLTALGLAFADYAASAIVMIGAASLWPELVRHAFERRLVAPNLPIITVIAVSLVNPVFEEVFVCGYVVSSLRERIGVSGAVNISAAIRVAYHLYQGVAGVLSITPFALITATWFARTRRLAPVVLAHALMDLVGLSLAS